jgi:hypothetical protein
VAVGAIRRFFGFLAKMGLAVKDDPPKTIDLAGREWGEAAGGLALSIRALPREDPDQLPAISVVLRNISPERKRFTTSGWLFFYRVEIDAPLTTFGRELLKPERNTSRLEVSLGAGEATETEIPVGTLYDLREKRSYRLRASCGDGVHSNWLFI